jgi:hypothetical protein
MASRPSTTIAAALLVLTSVTAAQPAPPAKLRIGIYAPSVEFGTAQARLAYVQALAKAIEQNTGIKTDAQSYASITALRGDNVDFAIIDGPCYAMNLTWKLLANASIGGAVARPWALYSSAGDTMQALKGKKLAFVATGCNDAGFVDNAMLESEVDAQFFGARVGEKDLTGAIADVASYKTAQAVFAPVGAAKGLTKIFDTGTVPNPAFVALGTKLPAPLADKVAAAVIGFGGSAAIAGWTKPAREPFTALASRLARVVKQGVLAPPDPVRIDAPAVLLEPPTLRDTAFVSIRHHFIRPPGARMD